ncbi:FxSxx-COOH system tetratricopeptide repeat protein [Streptomyces sp. NPDC001595]|uniref:FxSxx-COOH system tetratricopeptide repeat protein n=1 Tax=Streptomyces sp. NPDC001532 TaxID=3154520 RepID=UPI0033169432
MAVESRAGEWFISYARDDRAWAEWIAWHLQDAGLSVGLDTARIPPGARWDTAISTALRNARHMLVLVSASSRSSRWAQREREQALASGITVVPVRLDDTPLTDGLDDLRGLRSVRLTGLDEHAARDAVLRAVAPDGPPGSRVLRRLGASSPRLPGSLPRIWNVPRRSDGFVGRGALLSEVRTALTEQAVVALVGEPGIGKTQLAVEYAHRFAGEYELVWWIRADHEPVAARLAGLAARTGAAGADTRAAEALLALVAELRTRGRWLLVFDDLGSRAELPPELLEVADNGQILITSRGTGWPSPTRLIEVGRLSTEESVSLLRELVPSLSRADAGQLAADVGGMPLALSQAASIIGAGVPVGAYRRALPATEVTGTAPRSLQTTVRLALDLLAPRVPEAEPLVTALSLLAPEPFPLRHGGPLPDWTPAPLRSVARDPLVRERVLEAIGGLGLVQVDGDTVQLHPLTVTAVRDRLSPPDRDTAALGAQALLVAALPSRSEGPESWVPLLPHLMAVEPRDLTRPEGYEAVHTGCLWLLEHGEPAGVPSRLGLLRTACSERFGAKAALTLDLTASLARALDESGEPAEARPLLEGLMEELNRIHGGVDPETLTVAAHLTAVLGALDEPDAATELGSRTLHSMQVVLGPDHPRTLALASVLVPLLQATDKSGKALELAEDVFQRYRRVYGSDEAHTMAAAAQVAALLEADGHPDALRQARGLREDLVHWHSRSSGPASAAALRARVALSATLSRLGMHELALGRLEGILQEQTQLFGRRHAETMDTVAVLAVVLFRADAAGSALRLTAELLDWQRDVLGPDAPRTLRTAALKAALHFAAGETVPALSAARDAHAQQAEAYGEEHPDTQRTAVLLADCLDRAGAPQLATRMRRRLPPGLSRAEVVDRLLDDQLTASVLRTPPREAPVAEKDPATEPRPGRVAGSLPEPTSVLVSYVTDDEFWARWVRHELLSLGHRVTMEAEDTHPGRPLAQDSRIVLALLSPAYLERMAHRSWTAADWAELRLGHSLGRRRFVPLLVHLVEPERLPHALREEVVPSLYDLDSDAARELLRFALTAPTAPSRGPEFPGSSAGSDSGEDLLTRRLVNALERSAGLQQREGRELWLSLIGADTGRPMHLSRGEVSLRTLLYEVVRTVRSASGSLLPLVEALEALEPGSPAVDEARRVAEELERRRQSERRQGRP